MYPKFARSMGGALGIFLFVLLVAAVEVMVVMWMLVVDKEADEEVDKVVQEFDEVDEEDPEWISRGDGYGGTGYLCGSRDLST